MGRTETPSAASQPGIKETPSGWLGDVLFWKKHSSGQASQIKRYSSAIIADYPLSYACKALHKHKGMLYFGAVPRAALQTLASGQGGLFDRQQAIEVGVSPQLLQHYLRRGSVERVRRGIYRLVSVPTHPHEDLIEYWIWSDREGIFSGTTALELWRLGDALGVRTHMTLPTKWRKRRIAIPNGLVVRYEDVANGDVAWSDVVPMTAAAKTVLECAEEGLPRELVAQAVEEGVRRGLFRRPQVRAAGRYVRKGFTETARGTS